MRSVIVGAVVALLFVEPALACSIVLWPPPPDPPPGLSREQEVQFLRDWEEAEARRQELSAAERQLKYQSEKWDKADGVIVARVEATLPYKTQTIWGYSLDLMKVEMMPMRWLKGEGKLPSFVIATTGIDSCGDEPAWQGLRGKTGEEFVVYFVGATPSQDTVLEAIAPANILEPKARAALTQQ